MKIKIACQKCGVTFELTDEHEFDENGFLVCPNCCAKFPQKAYQDLGYMMHNYAELQKQLTVESDLGTEHPFQVNFSD